MFGQQLCSVDAKDAVVCPDICCPHLTVLQTFLVEDDFALTRPSHYPDLLIETLFRPAILFEEYIDLLVGNRIKRRHQIGLFH